MATPNIGLLNISQIASELEGMLHGTTLNSVTNIEGCYNRAARRIMEDVDPQETKIVSTFGKVYDGVWDYPFATDVKGNKLIDLYPQANRNLSDNFTQVYNKTFDLYKNFNLVPDFTPRYAGAVRTLRISANNLNTGISIDPANAYNDDGQWTAVQNVSNIGTNNQLTTDGGSGSVQFDINQTGVPASVAVIENDTLASVDLTNHFNNADEFFSFYIPTASGITSIEYRFGNDNANYYSSGALTTDMLDNTFSNGWNTIKKVWSEFSTVGSPDYTDITYVQIRIIYNGTLQTQVLLNQFWSRLGVIFTQEYYSKYLFRDSVTNAFKAETDSEDDFVNLDIDGLNLFVFATLGEIAQQVQGSDALFFDASQAETRYQNSLAIYKNKYKSEVTKPHTQYYTQPAAGYRKWFGFRNR